LLLGLLAVCIGGLVVLYSATGEDSRAVTNQAIRLGLGFAVMLVFAQVPPRTFRYWSLPLFAVGTVLLIGVLIFGVVANGAQRWLPVPVLGRFQPSEIMKLALPFTVAWYLSRRTLPPRFKDIVVCLLIVAVPTGL